MHGIARFATFELDLQTGELRNRGIRLRLRRQSAEILEMLVARPGEVVTRDEIRDKLWPGGTIVEFDHSVNSAVNRLREVLGDSPATPRYVETLPRVGYRFVGAVETEQPASGEPAPPPAALHAEPLAARTPERRPSRIIWPAAALLATGILIAAAMIAARHRLVAPSGAANAPPTIRTLAVLPLTNLSSNPDEDYFAEGVTEELLTELAHINAWRVISRTSVMRYKGTRKALPEIARELGVDAVIEGTVQRSGGRMRITAQLIQAATDTHLWAGSFERDMSHALTVQREIAESIARAVRVRAAAPERLHPSFGRNVVPEAYEAYLRGRYFMNLGQYLKAAAWLDQAVAKDAGLAAAYALLYEADAMTAYQRDLPLPPRALHALERARALDPSLADVHTDAGDLAFCWDWNWKAAEAEFSRAVEIDPGSVEAVAHYALYFHAMARWQPAAEWSRRLQELDPVSPRAALFSLRFYVNTHRYELAENEFRKIIELDPESGAAYLQAGILFERQGREPDALAASVNLERLRFGSAHLEALRDAAQKGGVRGYWGKQIELLREQAQLRRIPPMDFAMAYIRMGDKDRAMEMLEEAYRQRAPRLIWLSADAIWDPLRSDPRFRALLRRMRLPR
jgi:TolB-like protein/DNA-binding winged helix-turn-helix (wHTH) protein